MISINATYKDEAGFISIRRSAKESDNFEMMVGEIIYALEVQKVRMFVAHDEFQKCSIPKEFRRNCTVLNDENENFTLKITMCRLHDK